MRKLILAVAAVFFLAVALYMPREAAAVPAFARQTGMACSSCHFQHFPTLNAFGRAFKSGGYTQIGGESLIEGEMLSLPSVLNASLFTRVRYQKTGGKPNDSGTNSGQLQFPSDAGLLIGGRGGEHIGFLLELSLIDADAGNRFTSYKMPIVYNVADTNLSVIPYSTDSGGASYGFELLNTGAMKMQAPFEHGAEVSAAQYLGTGTSATGLAFVAAHSLWFANFSLWSPIHGTNDAKGYLKYGRLAVTPTIAGLDLAAGVQWWGGNSRIPSAATQRQSAKAWAIDAQMQGNVANFPVGIYAQYAIAGKSSSAADANVFNSSLTESKKAWNITGEVGVLPERLTLGAAYLSGKNGTLNGNSAAGQQNAVTLIANYHLAQNVELQLDQSWYSGQSFKTNPAKGSRLTTLVLAAAF